MGFAQARLWGLKQRSLPFKTRCALSSLWLVRHRRMKNRADARRLKSGFSDRLF
jgi:hypothetical protein